MSLAEIQTLNAGQVIMTPLSPLVFLQRCWVWTIDLLDFRVNPYDLRSSLAQAGAQAGEAADLFHRGRHEVGQQGHCDPLKTHHVVVSPVVAVHIFAHVRLHLCVCK